MVIFITTINPEIKKDLISLKINCASRHKHQWNIIYKLAKFFYQKINKCG